MIKVPVKSSGSFQVKIIRDNKVRFESHLQNNLLLDKYYQSGNASALYLAVGTGSTVPVVTDTALANYLATSSSYATDTQWPTVEHGVDGTDLYWKQKKEFSFNLGAVVGNISELGLSNTSNGSAGSFYTRALFRDANGDPTTYTLTASDQLVITYYCELRLPIQPGSFVISADINGVQTDITVTPTFLNSGAWSPYRFAMLHNYKGRAVYSSNIVVDAVTATVISGSSSSLSPAATWSNPATGNSNVGKPQILTNIAGLNDGNATFNQIGITDGNLSNNFIQILLNLDTPITKVNTEILTVSITFLLKESVT